MSGCIRRGLIPLLEDISGALRTITSNTHRHRLSCLRNARRTSVSSPGGVTEGESTTHHHEIDALLERVDAHWSVVDDPAHARSLLQHVRLCHTIGRNMPKDLMLRFVIAKDEGDGKFWVLPDARGTYPGRGVNVVASFPSVTQAPNWFSRGFKMNGLRLPNDFEHLVDAEMVRDTQRAFLSACASATAVRVLSEYPAGGERPDTASATNSFSDELDAAVLHSLRKHELRAIETNTSEEMVTSWLLDMSDEGAQSDLPEVFRADDGTVFRVLMGMRVDEVRDALSRRVSNFDVHSWENSQSVEEKLLDALNKFQPQDVGAKNKYIVLDGVNNSVSNKLRGSQLRLFTFRRTQREAGTALAVNKVAKWKKIK